MALNRHANMSGLDPAGGKEPKTKGLALRWAYRGVVDWRARSTTRRLGLSYWFTVSSVNSLTKEFQIAVLMRPGVRPSDFKGDLKILQQFWPSTDAEHRWKTGTVKPSRFAEGHFWTPNIVGEGLVQAATSYFPISSLSAEECWLTRCLYAVWSIPGMAGRKSYDSVRVVRCSEGRTWVEILFGIHKEGLRPSDLIGPLRGLRYPRSRMVKFETGEPRKYIFRIPVEEIGSRILQSPV